MKANLEQLEKMQEDLFRQQCDLDIQKAMVKHFIKKEKAKQLTLTDVVKPFYCLDEVHRGREDKCKQQCEYCTGFS
jgi:hypothetical protein